MEESKNEEVTARVHSNRAEFSLMVDWLCVHPSQRLQIIQEIMFGKSWWKMNLLMSTLLWWHGNAANFLNLRMIRRAYSIQVSSNLSSEICYVDELL